MLQLRALRAAAPLARGLASARPESWPERELGVPAALASWFREKKTAPSPESRLAQCAARAAAAPERYDPRRDAEVSAAVVALLANDVEHPAALESLGAIAEAFAQTPSPAKHHARLYDAVVAAHLKTLKDHPRKGALAAGLVESLRKAGLLPRYADRVDALAAAGLLAELPPAEAYLAHLALHGCRWTAPPCALEENALWHHRDEDQDSLLASLRRLDERGFCAHARTEHGIPVPLGDPASKRAVLFADATRFKQAQRGVVPRADRFRAPRLLRNLGWDAAVVPFYDWPKDPDAQDAFLAHTLELSPALRRLDFARCRN